MKLKLILAAVLSMSQLMTVFSSARETNLKIYVPKAPPSVPLLELEQKGYSIDIIYYNDVNSEILPRILKNEPALYIIPTNVSAKLYSKSRKIIQISVSSMGLVKIISLSEKIRSLNDLQGTEISIPAPGSSPDVISRYLFKRASVMPAIRYGSTPEITRMILAGKIDTAVLPEPMASLVLSKKTAAHVVSDTAEDWAKFVKGSSGIPQVGICGEPEYVKKTNRAINLFLEDYAKAVKSVINNPKDAAAKGKLKLELALPEDVLSASIMEMNLVHITGNRAYTELVGYFKVLQEMDPSSIGGTVPDSNFMMK